MTRLLRLFVLSLPLALASIPSAEGLSPDRGLTQALRRIWQFQQGLPDATILCVRQLGAGYLYLGTPTGLTRFDGMRFTKIDAVGNAWVEDVVADEAGDLWLATDGAGVIRLHKEQATTFGSEEGLSSLSVRQVLFDQSGALLACTAEGIERFSNGKFTQLPIGDAGRDVETACVAADGKLWIGGKGARVVVWDGHAATVRQLKTVPETASVRAILQEGRGEAGAMWIGTTAGLVRLKGDEEMRFTTKEGLADDWVYSLTQGANGVVWVGTRNGFSRVRSAGAGAAGSDRGIVIDSFQAQDGLSQSTVYSVCEDREGSVWVGTKHGLNQFWDGRVIPFTVSEGLPSNDVGPVCDDGTGSGAWVGTLGAGLSRFDGHRFTTLTTAQGLASNTVLSLAGGEKGELWVGTDRGVNEMRGGRVVRAFHVADGLPGEGVRDLFRTREGELWVGTGSGAVVMSGSAHSPTPPEAAGVGAGRFEVPVGAEALGRAAIAGFAEREGEVLIATEDERLYGYKDGHLREVAHDELLRGVDALYTDAGGLVWIGTVGGGLRLLDGEKLTAFTVREGLFDDDVYGIVEDGRGAEDRLWMTCSKGIFFVSRADLLAMARDGAGKLKHLESTPFSPTEGLRTIEGRSGVQPAAWRMGDGRLWFSTIHGVIVIDPRHLERATGAAPAVIEDVIVNGHSEPADQIGTLAAGVKNLEFHYTALSFVVPVRIGFRYQLEGFDRDWVDAGPRREAFYTNLLPGNYVFRVQAKNIEGTWSEAATAGFTLAPYFYQRAWFWPACVLAAVAAGFVAYRLRIRAIKGRLNAIVAERSRIARELHDTLLQGFSGVTMEMQALSARLPESQERGTLVEIIRDAANCMKEARRSVAGLRPPPRGATEGETVGLGAAVGEAARHLTETRDVKLVLDVEERLPALGAEVEYNLVRICQEAVTNAVKHSGARIIEVSLKRADRAVRLMVRDDGKGFETGVNGMSGHYGIVGMRERAGAIHGTLEVESQVGRGTVVRVVVGMTNEK